MGGYVHFRPFLENKKQRSKLGELRWEDVFHIDKVETAVVVND